MSSRLARALAYPYDRPNGSFVMSVARGVQPFDMADISERTPVIVAGSNAAPSRLADKYAADQEAFIPVQNGLLRDFSPVYSCHFSAYGSVPATMTHDPGGQSHIHVVWLTESQLAIMHQTESLGQNYRFALLEDIELSLDGGPVLERCAAYLSLKGALHKDGEPIRLAELDSGKSRFTALNQTEIQNYCRALLDPKKNLERFVMENIDDPAVRRDRIAQLRHYGDAVSCPKATTLAGQELK